jgi:hypothetical protein
MLLAADMAVRGFDGQRKRASSWHVLRVMLAHGRGMGSVGAGLTPLSMRVRIAPAGIAFGRLSESA